MTMTVLADTPHYTFSDNGAHAITVVRKSDGLSTVISEKGVRARFRNDLKKHSPETTTRTYVETSGRLVWA